MVNHLTKAFIVTTCIICSNTLMAQVISFSMDEEATSKNTPEGWTEVQLPQNLPAFTEANTFYITNYGASTESADNTTAIQNALNAANSAGGGMVVIPAGEWLSNTIQVGSKTVLHLCAGAMLKWIAWGNRSATEGNNFITNKGTPTDVVIEGEIDSEIYDASHYLSSLK